MVSFSSSAFSTAALLVVATAAASSSSSAGGFTPTRIRYEDLVNGRASLLDALSGSSGIVSLTDLPGGFSSLKKEVLSDLHPCIADQLHRDDDDDNDVAVQRFPDGTIRRSLATATTASDGPLKLRGGDDDAASSSASCRSFRKNLDGFRSLAREATDAFAVALSRELEPYLEKPLLHVRRKGDDEDEDDPSNRRSGYDTVLDLVRNGEQLEHFHSYVKTEEEERRRAAGGEEYRDDDDDDDDRGGPTRMETIDVHADQGFFIAFTPGMMVSSSSTENNDADAVSSSSSAGGFFIVEEDSKDGAPVHVDFDVDVDDLVFMLGDGVNQYVNDRFLGDDDRRRLRATPHAVSLKAQRREDDDGLARVWYGRMVLPPDDALVAPGSTQTTLTFGDVRRRLAETPDDRVPAGLGCSSPTARALQHGGSEEASACAKDTLLCWARCMELSDYDISEEICAEEQNLQVKCINPRGQFHTGEGHGDFWPACSNTTVEVTPYPEIPQTPEEVDTTASWEAFVGEDGDVDGVSYEHSFNLTNDNNKGVVLQWSVVDEEKGVVRGRLAFNDVFGWLAIGFAHPEGQHNGMNGADILLALPGGNYTPMFGLEVPGRTRPGTDEISVEISKKKKSLAMVETVNPEGATVHEYVINPEGSSFRHWYEPTRTDRSDSMSVVLTDYATALTWETDGINGRKFDMTGFDDMIWGGNSKDYHVGYHGRGNRARFLVNWVTGEAELWKPDDDEEDGGHESHDNESDDHQESDDSAAAVVVGRSAGFLAGFAVVAAAATVIF